MAAELDDWRLVEESTGVEQEDEDSRADEPGAHVTQLTLRTHDDVLLAGSVLLVQWSNAVVKQRNACTAVERDE